MDELRLESWERPHGATEPLIGSIHWQTCLEWRGRMRRFGARIVRVKRQHAIVFVCDLNEPHLGNWVLCHGLNFSYAHSLHRYPNHGYYPYLDSMLQSVVEGQGVVLCRFFVWGARRCAIVAESGEGSWLRFNHLFFIPSAFKIENFHSVLWFYSSQNTRDVLQKCWEQEPEIRFAYQWSQLGYRQKMALWFGTPLEEICHLMKLVLLSASASYPGDFSFEWYVDVREPKENVAYAYDPQGTSSPIQEAWLDRFHAYFGALLYNAKIEELKERPCMKKFLSDNPSFRAVQIPQSTFHERLEARLQLREWLQQNAPDQIELLPE